MFLGTKSEVLKIFINKTTQNNVVEDILLEEGNNFENTTSRWGTARTG